ncbi:59cd7e45-77e5-4ee2-8f5a-c683c6bb4517 [Sclerotinia trifoliorum]|uniref:59cd7e45-77e5-4ee2-8f5a-c683c6bb4517 n=1 Tax=Sclerotinia trifoliorum TaxID=28548 RepID=A0A8H2ZVS6_9HELO|nr:59cd7e45-77e5-4ee2-8f5a-c683c6bb4517 [Sclerotinia trifoliorum]
MIEKRNDALRTNPDVFHYPTSTDIGITSRGSDVYWAITAAMAFATICFLAWSFRIPRSKRIFHYITAAITMTAAIAYFTMASNLGYASIIQEFQRGNPKVRGVTREIFYVRYIDWVVTTPLLLLDILLTAGLPWPTILFTIFLDEVMIITGLVGALVASSYKWGYFVFAMFALFGIAWNILFVGARHAKALGTEVNKAYWTCGGLTMFLWFLYPIAWGLSEGGNIIAPDSEAVFYGVLDVLAKIGFGILLLNGHRNIDPAHLGLHIRDYNEQPVSLHEKNSSAPVAGAGTGATGGYGNTYSAPGATAAHSNAAARDAGAQPVNSSVV